MFNNSGKKIKFIAEVIFWVCCIISMACSIGLCTLGVKFTGIAKEVLVVIAFVNCIFGPLLSWIFTLLIYGYGEIIDALISKDKE
jgi:hypothetical protein